MVLRAFLHVALDERLLGVGDGLLRWAAAAAAAAAAACGLVVGARLEDVPSAAETVADRYVAEAHGFTEASQPNGRNRVRSERPMGGADGPIAWFEPEGGVWESDEHADRDSKDAEASGVVLPRGSFCLRRASIFPGTKFAFRFL